MAGCGYCTPPASPRRGHDVSRWRTRRTSGVGGRVNREPDEPSGPDPAADEFEAIVAGWRREGAVPAWPGDDRPPAEPPRTPPVRRTARSPRCRTGRTGRRRSASSTSSRPSRRRCPGSARPPPSGSPCSSSGLTLVIAPGVVGVSNVYGLPLGLLALASGLGWLVLRLWPAPPDDRDEDDDGAQTLARLRARARARGPAPPRPPPPPPRRAARPAPGRAGGCRGR